MTDMDYIALGQRIRDLRRKRGLTQEQLAELADLSTPYVSHLERGSKKASLAVLVRLAESLGVTVDRLLSGNQVTDSAAYYSEVQELLEDCTTCERAVLTDIISTAKRSIRTHGMSQPP
jgi:transcriptional regulator with XRE-family HTH domain